MITHEEMYRQIVMAVPDGIWVVRGGAIFRSTALAHQRSLA
jgi:hypothetical protein